MGRSTILDRSPLGWADRTRYAPDGFVRSLLSDSRWIYDHPSSLSFDEFGRLAVCGIRVAADLILPTLSRYASARAFTTSHTNDEYGTLAIGSHYLEYRIDSRGHSIKLDGQFHSLNGCPGFVDHTGSCQTHYRHGLIHSDEGPAVTWGSNEKYFLYGQEISHHRFYTKIFDPITAAYTWRDLAGRLHSESSLSPSCIEASGKVQYHSHGLLHNDFMSAVITPGEDFVAHQYWIYGRSLSSLEALKFSSETNEIIFKDGMGQLDREDGPAYIKIELDGSTHDLYYRRGKLHNENGPAVVHKKKGQRTLVEFWLDGERQHPKSDLKKIEPVMRVNLMGNTVNQGERMSEQNDIPNNRLNQLTTGAKHGLKKGAVKVVSEKASKAITGVLPIGNNVAGERLVQITLLLAGAELMERVPDNVGSRVGLTDERRHAFGSLCRHLGGETLGRDAVELVSQLAPLFADALSTLSADDITEAANSLQADQNVDIELPAQK